MTTSNSAHSYRTGTSGRVIRTTIFMCCTFVIALTILLLLPFYIANRIKNRINRKSKL
jgi:hypothetical protein